MSKLLPWLKINMTPVNIERLDEEAIPENSGIYIMLSDHTEYIYPWSKNSGSSGVFYIGCSNNLRNRLKTHKKYCSQRISDKNKTYYWPFYEYAAHHGCNVVWKIDKNYKDAENKLLVEFANYYGAKPVANGQSGW